MGFLKRHLTTGLLAFGSAALTWASFPPLDCGFFAWVALTPWLVMAGRSASRRAWLWSLLAGYALFLALLHWLRYVGPEGWVALALYCALYWPAATLLLGRLKRRGLPFALTAPVTFAAFEFVRGNIFTGFAFYFLAHTQYRWLPIVQVADITGVYGITFLIALVNGCLADLILECGVRSAERGVRSAGYQPAVGQDCPTYNAVRTAECGAGNTSSRRPPVPFPARSRPRSWPLRSGTAGAGCARSVRSRGRRWRSSRGTCRRASRTRRRSRTRSKTSSATSSCPGRRSAKGSRW